MTDFMCMCLDGDKFEELCDLYPESRELIAKRGLIKRKLFVDNLKRQRDLGESNAKNFKPFIYDAENCF